MRRKRRTIHALAAVSLAAAALFSMSAPRAASAQTAPPAVLGAPCPTPAQVACELSDACLQERLQELARIGRDYIPILQEAVHHPLLYRDARPLLTRWQAILRLADMGTRAPRAEVCEAVGYGANLVEATHNFRMRLPLARDVGAF